ncbi:MAG: condensation domain-containing protein, partial [Chloroflexota bacterium]
VPLTPIQAWFFEQQFAQPHHWNMSTILTITTSLKVNLLRLTCQHLANYHDAVRLRFNVSPETQRWQQWYAPVNSQGQADIPVTCIDLSIITADRQAGLIQAAAAKIQTTLNLREGPLLRIVYFEGGATQASHLLVVAHHLIIDGVSWRILFEDLQTIYQQLAAGQSVQLLPKTTSFKRWAEHLHRYANAMHTQQRAAEWYQQADNTITLPVDKPWPSDKAIVNSEASAQTVTTLLTPEETDILLRHYPSSYDVRIEALLITALADTIRQWCLEVTATNNDQDVTLLLDVEGHGRVGEIGTNLDLSRTLGWFTTLYPLQLRLQASESLLETARAVQERLQQLPQQGLAYGLLRYVSRDSQLRQQPSAEVSFNYLGQFNVPELKEDSLFSSTPSFSQRETGPPRSLAAHRTHLVEVNSYISDSVLSIEWTYSRTIHRQETIERRAHHLINRLQGFCRQLTVERGPIPVDSSMTAADQAYLKALIKSDKPLEAIYPLSKMQRLILEQSLKNGHAPVYHIQWSCIIQGSLQVAAFQKAWQMVIDRHSILRTTFIWKGLSQPFQLVYEQVELSWLSLQWQTLPPDEQQVAFNNLLQDQLQQGFDLTTHPLTHFTLITLGPGTYRFVWNHHHLVLDGWSTHLLWNDVATYYQAICEEESLSLSTDQPLFEAYITYEKRRFSGQAHGQPVDSVEMLEESDLRHRDFYLDREMAKQLQQLGAQHHLTLNTLIQGVWLATLQQVLNKSSITLGLVVSDRPPELNKADQMVGLLLKMVAYQAPSIPDELTIAWLAALQTEQVQLRDNIDISVSSSDSVDAVLRFQNYPADQEAQPLLNQGLRLSQVEWTDYWPYPLAIEVIPAETIKTRVSYDSALLSSDLIETLILQFKQRVTQLLDRFM